jgi:hypothetical protein
MTNTMTKKNKRQFLNFSSHLYHFNFDYGILVKNICELNNNSNKVIHTYEVQMGLSNNLSLLKILKQAQEVLP